MAEKKQGKKQSRDPDSKKKPIQIHLTLMDLLDMMKKAVSHGKGFLESVEAKLEEKIRQKIKAGEISANEGREAAKEMSVKIRELLSKLNTRIDSGVKKSLKALNLVTIDDLKELESKLNAILKKMDPVQDTQGKKDNVHRNPVSQAAPKAKPRPLKKTARTPKAKNNHSPDVQKP